MTKPFISNEKYETTGETKDYFGITLHRIKAKIAIGVIAAGTIGGWVEKESNISVSGNAWVYGNACVSGNARVYGDARVYGNAWVYGNACVFGDACVFGNACVSGDAWVYGAYRHITISPIGQEGGCLTAFVERDGTIRLNRGCFSGTIDELTAKVAITHGESGHAITYRLAVDLIRSRLDTKATEEGDVK